MKKNEKSGECGAATVGAIEEELMLISERVNAVVGVLDGLTPSQVDKVIHDTRYIIENTPIQFKPQGVYVLKKNDSFINGRAITDTNELMALEVEFNLSNTTTPVTNDESK